MDCSDLKQYLANLYDCRVTEDGLRLSTSCLYPSFDQVFVYITSFGDGFAVHDGGGAAATAWEHGRDEPLIRKMLTKAAQRFRINCEGTILVTNAVSADWLPSAVLAVANASCFAANSVMDHLVAASESDIASRIFKALLNVYPEPLIKREFELEGGSGKNHRFDFAVGDVQKRIVLLDAITPHHSSIAHKYTAFSDVRALPHGVAQGFAVFERRLEPDDAALIQQVADLIPISSVSEGTVRALA